MRTADEIAYWLEVAEGRAYADVYRAASTGANPLAAAVTVEGDVTTFLLGAVDDGFFNRSIGLGVGAPATEDSLDRAIDAFTMAGRQAWAIQLSPFARPSALERWLEARRLRRGRRWAKVWRDTEDPPTARTDLRIEPIGPERADEWTDTTLDAFEMPAALAPLVAASLGRPGWHHYLAFDADQAVAASGMFLTDAAAWLGFASTRTSHRGRGAQSSMLARRIRDALDLGAGLCIAETGEETPESPNPSYRNMLRAGFRLGYQRQNWLPPAPPVDAPTTAS